VPPIARFSLGAQECRNVGPSRENKVLEASGWRASVFPHGSLRESLTNAHESASRECANGQLLVS